MESEDQQQQQQRMAIMAAGGAHGKSAPGTGEKVGAIMGGTVGAIILVLLIALIIWIFWYRSKHEGKWPWTK